MGSRYGSLGRNPASKKTILANGGVFEKTVEVDGSRIKRYWILPDSVR